MPAANSEAMAGYIVDAGYLEQGLNRVDQEKNS